MENDEGLITTLYHDSDSPSIIQTQVYDYTRKMKFIEIKGAPHVHYYFSKIII